MGDEREEAQPLSPFAAELLAFPLLYEQLTLTLATAEEVRLLLITHSSAAVERHRLLMEHILRLEARLATLETLNKKRY